MSKRTTTFIAALFLAFMFSGNVLAQSVKSRSQEPCENDPVKVQTIGLTERELLARAEERAESLRTRVFDIKMQELDLQARLEDLDYRSSPESLTRLIVFISSVRPMDELRDTLRGRFESEKARVNKQLEMLASSRERLEAAIREADSEVERLRQLIASGTD